jgi:hypothetical protein
MKLTNCNIITSGISSPDAYVGIFNVTSTNSGLEAGELVSVSHTGSISLVVNTQALYSLPAVTVTFGNVATYSIMPPPPVEFPGIT